MLRPPGPLLGPLGRPLPYGEGPGGGSFLKLGLLFTEDGPPGLLPLGGGVGKPRLLGGGGPLFGILKPKRAHVVVKCIYVQS